MIKLIRFVVVVSLAFGAGYYLGAQREERIEKIFSSVRTETKTKVSSLEKEVRSLKFKVLLTSAKDQIASAREDIQERNFGSAEKKLTNAREDIQKAVGMASRGTEEALKEILEDFDPALPLLKRSNPRATTILKKLQDKLEQVVEELPD